MQILSGQQSALLAQHIASQLNVPYIAALITTFDNSETRVQVLEDTYDQIVIIIHSITKPVNDRLMELLLLIDTIKRAGAKHIITVIPYFVYCRSDRCSYTYSPIAASLVANLLETAGTSQIITIDLHSPQIEGFFNIPIQNLNPINLFSNIIELTKNSVIVAPDIGSIQRASNACKLFNLDMVVINKIRHANNKLAILGIIGNVKGKHCILIDDIVDSGETICKGGKLLIENGALSVDALITHPVLSNRSIKHIEDSVINNIYITDSIETKNLPSKFHIISIAPIIIQALRKFMKI